MKRQTHKRRYTKSKRSSQRLNPLNWLLIGLLMGVIISMVFHYGFHHKNLSATPGKIAYSLEESAKTSTLKKSKKHKSVVTPSSGSKYDFYTLLSKDNDNNEEDVSSVHDIENNLTKKFALQVATFKSSSEADQFRAELIIEGYEVFLSQTHQEDKSIIRVNVGPFATLKQAQKIQHQLQENGHVSPLIVKVD